MLARGPSDGPPPRRPARVGATWRSFLPTTRGVLARVLMTVLSLALVAGVIVAAQPAGAASRRPDALADAAAAALTLLSGSAGSATPPSAEYVLTPATRWWWRPRPVFAQARLAVASLAAPRAGLDPAALDAVWAATDRAAHGGRAAPRSPRSACRTAATRPSPAWRSTARASPSWAWGEAGRPLPRSSGSQISAAAASP